MTWDPSASYIVVVRFPLGVPTCRQSRTVPPPCSPPHQVEQRDRPRMRPAGSSQDGKQ